FPYPLVVLSGPFHNRPTQVSHVPGGDPLATLAPALFPLGAGIRSLHAAGDAGLGPDRDVGLHATLPESTLAQLVGRVARAAHAVLINPHVAIGHRDGVDVRVHESPIPGHRVGDAVNVIPTAGVEPDEVLAEGGA